MYKKSAGAPRKAREGGVGRTSGDDESGSQEVALRKWLAEAWGRSLKTVQTAAWQQAWLKPSEWRENPRTPRITVFETVNFRWHRKVQRRKENLPRVVFLLNNQPLKCWWATHSVFVFFQSTFYTWNEIISIFPLSICLSWLEARSVNTKHLVCLALSAPEHLVTERIDRNLPNHPVTYTQARTYEHG